MNEINTKIYTIFMPGEERYFFKYFHLLGLAAMITFTILGVIYSGMSAEESFIQALVFVVPLYFVYFVFGKRFARQVTLDFDAKKISFIFHDQRGIVVKDFAEVKKIHFQYYLTFVLEDAKVMVKRPPDKKEVFKKLNADFILHRGIFAAP
ncbi:MAG: hypothetical protein M8357_05460 [Desulfobulbaceae bacterium]|nr:hypothetical protein [Desulfobulbaceae bacterium]